MVLLHFLIELLLVAILSMRSIIFFAALLGLLSACGQGPGADQGATATAADSAQATAAAAPVLLVAPEDLRTLSPSLLASGPVITGSLQPERRADLRSELSAVVLQVLKENGEPVKRGDLLVRLDDTAIRDSVNSAEEAVRASSQAFDQTERQVQRFKTLQGQGMMSMQALEDAEVRRNNAQSDLVSERSRAVSARQQLRRTEVRAPFDGVVSERKVSAGDTASVGKELLKVIAPSSMRFEGLVSADRMHEIQVGQTVAFRVNGFPDAEFMGKVNRVDATANAVTRQVEVVVNFSDPAVAPRVAGLFAEGRIESGSSQALTLPEAAITRTENGPSVWRVQGAQLQQVWVKLGERDPRRGEFPVLSGLTEGDRVLRKPNSSLLDGQRLELTGATQPVKPTAPSASAAVAAR